MNGSNLTEIATPAIFVIVSSVLVLVLQLFLCFETKQVILKLLPTLLLVICSVIFSVLGACFNGWDGFSYQFLALVSFVLIVVCGLGWVVWAIVRKKSR